MPPDSVRCESCGAGFLRVLADVVADGELGTLGESKSVGSGRRSRECLNYAITIDNPIARLYRRTGCPFRIPLAVARCVNAQTPINKGLRRKLNDVVKHMRNAIEFAARREGEIDLACIKLASLVGALRKFTQDSK